FHPKQAVFSLALSPDDRFLAALGDGIEVWDLQKGELRASLAVESRIISALFTPDGRYILSADHTNTVRVWNLAERRIERQIAIDSIGVARLTISPDGALLALVGQRTGGFKPGVMRAWADNRIRVLDWKTGRQ